MACPARGLNGSAQACGQDGGEEEKRDRDQEVLPTFSSGSVVRFSSPVRVGRCPQTDAEKPLGCFW